MEVNSNLFFVLFLLVPQIQSLLKDMIYKPSIYRNPAGVFTRELTKLSGIFGVASKYAAQRNWCQPEYKGGSWDAHTETLERQTWKRIALKGWLSEEQELYVSDLVKMCALALGAIALSSLFWILILKRQVAKKTEELRRTNEEMEKRIRERTEELRLIAKRAEEADRIKSAFLATMSHELRTPLNSIIGFTGVLLKELAGPLNEEQKKQLSMVQSSARHLLELINDVLDISKIEAKELELSVSEFDVKESTEKVLGMLVPLSEKKGLELRWDISDNVGRIVTDKRRFEQVLTNLMSNAVKFTEKGSIFLSCRREGDS